MANDFEIKQNDTWPPMKVLISDAGVPMDLVTAGVASVAFNFTTGPNESVIEVGAIEGAYATWTPSTTITAEVGAYPFEVELTYENGKNTTIPSIGYFSLGVNKEID